MTTWTRVAATKLSLPSTVARLRHHIRGMLGRARAVLRVSPPTSPSKRSYRAAAAHSQVSKQPHKWTAEQPIKFATQSPGNETSVRARSSKGNSKKPAWKPEDPIRLVRRSGQALQDGVADQPSPKRAKNAYSPERTADPPCAEDDLFSPSLSSGATAASRHAQIDHAEDPSHESDVGDVSSSSWPASHRWEPPSPSPSKEVHSPGSTARFSFGAGYNIVLEPDNEYYGSTDPDKQGVENVDRSFIGRQALSPPHPSQQELDELIEGVNFDSSFSTSFPSTEDKSFQSARESPASSPKITLRSRKVPLQSSQQGNKAASSPLPAFPSFPIRCPSPKKTISARPFTTQAGTSDLPPHPSQNSDRSVIIETETQKYDAELEAFDSSVEIMSEIIEVEDPKPRRDQDIHEKFSPPPVQKKVITKEAAGKENIAPGANSESTAKASTSILQPASGTKPKAKTIRQARREQDEKKKARDSELKASWPEFNFKSYGRKPELVYTKDEKVVDETLLKLSGPVGFDLEWNPAFRRNMEPKTALVQLCDLNTILLVHVAKMKRFPTSLKKYIEDATKIKLGVMIRGDGLKLRRDFGYAAAGLLELNDVSRVADPDRWSTPGIYAGTHGLQALIGHYLEKYLPKDNSVRCGAWDQELGDVQKYYAANDVYSSLLLYNHLKVLAKPGVDVDSFATSVEDPKRSLAALTAASASANAAKSPLKSAAAVTGQKALTERELEAYNTWITGMSATKVSEKMSAPPQRAIKATTIVWYSLTVHTRDEERYPIDLDRLLEEWESMPSNASKDRVEQEFPQIFSVAA